MYYITRQIIPPLNRVLKLVGVDAAVWFSNMPKRQLVNSQFRMGGNNKNKAAILDATFRTAHCLVCGGLLGKDEGEYHIFGKGVHLVDSW